MLIRSNMFTPEVFDLYLDTAPSPVASHNLLAGITEGENGVSARQFSNDTVNTMDMAINQTFAHAEARPDAYGTVGDGEYGFGADTGTQADADQAKELAEEEHRQARADSHRQGYEEGFGEGKARALSEYEQQIAQMQSLLDSVRMALVSGVQGSEDIAVEIVFAAICKIMGAQLATREGTVAVVQEAITHAGTRERVVVRVSPDDQILLNDVLSSVPARSGSPQLEVIADERVALGGCLLETAGGSLDARLEAQLKQFCDSLLRARDEKKAPQVQGQV